MTTTWNKITKASGTSWNKLSSGVTLYDDFSTTYDSSSTNYDGQLNSWTKIAKPAVGTTALPGQYYGIGLLTYSGGQTLHSDGWTRITKAT